MSIDNLKINSIDFIQYIDTYNLVQEINFQRSCITHNGEEFYVKYSMDKIVEILPTDIGTYRCYHTPISSVYDISECLYNDFSIDFSDGTIEMC